MSLYTFTIGQTLPAIRPVKGLRIEESVNAELLALMAGTTVASIKDRLQNDHVAFVAYMNGAPAAFGWMARGKAKIGELGHELVLPIGNRYLWNFRTVEQFRGLGIYPALLQHIIRTERVQAHRFWIIHAPENKSSLKGIQKSGFSYVGKLYNRSMGATIQVTSVSLATLRLLEEMDISISGDAAPSCWNCSSPYLKNRKSECCCKGEGVECEENALMQNYA